MQIQTNKKNNLYANDIKSEQLLAIYYLKYHLGDKFNFEWQSDSEEELYKSLDIAGTELKTYLPNEVSKQELEKYSKFLYAYGLLEDYLYAPEEDKRINFIIHSMVEAKKINTRDIWPQYWISYFETENAIYSGKKSDYKTALKSWEKLFENDLFYASPIIKLAYDKTALCAEKSGDLEKSAFYEDKAKNVNPLLDFDYKNYVYFGY